MKNDITISEFISDIARNTIFGIEIVHMVSGADIIFVDIPLSLNDSINIELNKLFFKNAVISKVMNSDSNECFMLTKDTFHLVIRPDETITITGLNYQIRLSYKDCSLNKQDYGTFIYSKGDTMHYNLKYLINSILKLHRLHHNE